VCRPVLETAIGPVLPLSDGKDREARWDSAAATGGVTQDPPCNRAARQGPATSKWRSAAEPNDQSSWLVKPLPRREAWKGLQTRPQSAAECLRHSSTGASDGRGCAIGFPALLPFALAQQAVPIRLLASHQPTPCSASTATAAACWPPLLPTGPTSNCRSPQRSSLWCARSGLSLSRCVEAPAVIVIGPAWLRYHPPAAGA